jgi:hypothetical protein
MNYKKEIIMKEYISDFKIINIINEWLDYIE